MPTGPSDFRGAGVKRVGEASDEAIKHKAAKKDASDEEEEKKEKGANDFSSVHHIIQTAYIPGIGRVGTIHSFKLAQIQGEVIKDETDTSSFLHSVFSHILQSSIEDCEEDDLVRVQVEHEQWMSDFMLPFDAIASLNVKMIVNEIKGRHLNQNFDLSRGFLVKITTVK